MTKRLIERKRYAKERAKRVATLFKRKRGHPRLLRFLSRS
jgi:hypothetical protein